jgi:hypothetical protein
MHTGKFHNDETIGVVAITCMTRSAREFANNLETSFRKESPIKNLTRAKGSLKGLVTPESRTIIEAES